MNPVQRTIDSHDSAPMQEAHMDRIKCIAAILEDLSYDSPAVHDTARSEAMRAMQVPAGRVQSPCQKPDGGTSDLPSSSTLDPIKRQSCPKNTTIFFPKSKNKQRQYTCTVVICHPYRPKCTSDQHDQYRRRQKDPVASVFRTFFHQIDSRESYQQRPGSHSDETDKTRFRHTSDQRDLRQHRKQQQPENVLLKLCVKISFHCHKCKDGKRESSLRRSASPAPEEA